MTATPSQQSCYIDVAFATFAVLIFAVIAYSFQYRESLGKSDLYRILVGLLDGKATGSELAGLSSTIGLLVSDISQPFTYF